jgi:copper chaperone NosL
VPVWRFKGGHSDDADVDLSNRLQSRSMKSRQGLLTALMAVSLIGIAAGCGEPRDPLAPPEIVYGEDVCDQCNMIISEPRFASALIVATDDGHESRIFDDIGDMLVYMAAGHNEEVVRLYVHDYDTEEWIDAETATFARAPRIPSPMGFGLAAFADSARASEVAAEHDGTVLDFEALTSTVGGDPTGHMHGSQSSPHEEEREDAP